MSRPPRKPRAAARALLAAALLATAAPPAAASAPESATAAVEEGGGYAGLPLAQALLRLQARGLPILFSSSLVRPDMTVAAEPDGATPREVLAQLLAPHGLRAVEGEDGRLAVVRDPRAAGTIRGVVVTAGGGAPRPLDGAEVLVAGTDHGTTAGGDGGFELPGVAPGIYTVECRLPGYAIDQQAEVTLAPGGTAEVRCALAPAPVALDEVVVSPSRYAILRQEPEARQFLSRQEVEQLPHLSDDLYRAVALLPGATGGDISAKFNLRGGEQDEVLVLVDGMEIYEPFHFEDFQSVFSIVDSEAVGGVEFLTGGFPAEYGDRMSGVLDVTSHLPSPPRTTALGVSFVHARVLSEGTFDGERGQWLASARRGYLDLVLDRVADDPADFQFSPEYYDLLTKVHYRLSDRTLLSGHLLAAHDDLEFLDDDGDETAEARYGQGYAWLTLETAWTSRLSSRGALSAGRVERRRTAASDDRSGGGRGGCTTCDDSFAEVRDDRSFDFVGLDQDWRYRLGGGHLLKWGLEVRHLTADYDYTSFAIVLSPLHTGSPEPVVTDRRLTLAPAGEDWSAYLADRFRLTPRLTAEVGLRWDRQSWTPGGEALSPRVNLVYDLGGRGALRAAWGRFYQSQGLHELQVEDGVDRFFPPQLAEHRLLSFERAFAGGLSLRLEAYEKELSALRPRYENLFEPIDLIPEAAPDRVRIAPDRGRARGLEVLLKAASGGRFSGWVGYARAEAEDGIDGETFPRSWDQEHAVSFSLNLRPGERWNFNLAGVYHSGWPITPVAAELRPDDDGRLRVVPLLGRRNSDRLPPYRRLDLRASRRVAARRGTLQFFVEVTNLLDRQNARAISDFDFLVQPDGSVRVVEEREYWLPRIPSFGLTWRF